MTTGTAVSTKRAGGRKTANKLTRYAGGAESSELLAAAQEIDSAGGITAGLASIAAADGQRFIEAPTEAIAPHPYNAPIRSTPQPDNGRWLELIGFAREQDGCATSYTPKGLDMIRYQLVRRTDHG